MPNTDDHYQNDKKRGLKKGISIGRQKSSTNKSDIMKL